MDRNTLCDIVRRLIGRHRLDLDTPLFERAVRIAGLDDLDRRRAAWRLRHDPDLPGADLLAVLDSRWAAGIVMGTRTVLDGHGPLPGLAQLLGADMWSLGVELGGVWPEGTWWPEDIRGLLGVIGERAAGHDRLAVALRVLHPADWHVHVDRTLDVLCTAVAPVVTHLGADFGSLDIGSLRVCQRDLAVALLEDRRRAEEPIRRARLDRSG